MTVVRSCCKIGQQSWLSRSQLSSLRDVRTRRIASFLIFSIFIVAVAGLEGQTGAPSPVPRQPLPQETQTPPPKATPPSSLQAGIFPLAAVHRGLHGVAYTVFEGVEPQAMEVEILGVLHNALGPHEDMILARLGGKESVYTGVVAGMSGSPVYIDGKLVGALAFRIGQFSKEPIAGITPIEQMFQVRNMPEAVPAVERLPSATAVTVGSSAPGLQASAEVQPIETPLVFSGFSAETVKAFGDKFTALGMMPVTGIGGGASDQKQPEPIVPGSAVSALLVRGDMEIAATCTATYVDPQQLLACGHPLTQYGNVSMPMTKAEVVATLPSPLNAFKIVNTTEEVGAFNQDRQTAIRGAFGAKARMIPVAVRLRDGMGAHASVDGQKPGGQKPGSQERTVRFDVIDNPDLTPLLLMISVYQSLMENNSYGAETTYGVRGRILTEPGPEPAGGLGDGGSSGVSAEDAGGHEVRLQQLEAPTEAMPSALSTALVVGDRFTRLYANRARQTRMRAVELEIEATPGRRNLEIESATPAHAAVRAGETVEIETVLRPYHGEMRHVIMPVRLPATLEPGTVRLVVSDGASLDRMGQTQGLAAQNLDVPETVAQLNALHANDRLYITMLVPAPQAAVEGRTLPAVPLSMANVLEPLRASRTLTLNGESAVPVTSVPMDAMVEGERVITLQVE